MNEGRPGDKADDEPTGLIETVLAGAVGFCAILASIVAAPGWMGGAGAALGAISITIAVVDRRKLIIPDELNAAAFLIGLAASALGGETAADGLARALTRAAFMFAAFLCFRAGFRSLRGFDGIGLGDVKLAAVAGAWLDWIYLPLAIEIAALSALTAALVRRLAGNDLDAKSKLPFGAFFAPAVWLCWILARLWDNGGAVTLSRLG